MLADFFMKKVVCIIREWSYLLLVKSFWYLMDHYPNSRDVISDFWITMKKSFVNTIPIRRPSSDIAKVFLGVLQTQAKILAKKAVNSGNPSTSQLFNL